VTEIYRSQTVWSGFPGGPATTTLYTSAIPVTSGIKAFFTALKPYVPPTVTWTIKGNGDKLEDSTGALTGAWSSGGDLTETANAGASAYAAPVGFLVTLLTSTIVHNHHVKGRIFMVPMSNGIMDTNGTLTGTALTAITTAANALVSSQSAQLGVWSRPVKKATPNTPVRPGQFCIVTGVNVPDKCVVLRSRRD
jgi:hypothetical protein